MPVRRHCPRPPRALPSLRAGQAAALALVLLVQALPAQTPAEPRTPAEAVEALLAADRAFSDSSATGELAAGLSRMFAPGVLMLHAGGRLVEGADSARAALAAVPANAGARASWAPIRGGVSADGRHGFTYGYMTIARADGTTHPAKYVAYWVRGDDGWRVAAYKRVPRPAGPVSDAVRPPALPARLVTAPADAAAVARHAAELREVELAFSRDAAGGLAAAFRRYGAPDAANVGGPRDAEFRFGPTAIAEGIAAGGEPPDIRWSASHTLVAASGDLGVNVGFIELPPNRPVPFLTIWRRAGPGEPWRYVAE